MVQISFFVCVHAHNFFGTTSPAIVKWAHVGLRHVQSQHLNKNHRHNRQNYVYDLNELVLVNRKIGFLSKTTSKQETCCNNRAVLHALINMTPTSAMDMPEHGNQMEIIQMKIVNNAPKTHIKWTTCPCWRNEWTSKCDTTSHKGCKN